MLYNRANFEKGNSLSISINSVLPYVLLKFNSKMLSYTNSCLACFI